MASIRNSLHFRANRLELRRSLSQSSARLGVTTDRHRYWQKIPRWRDTTENEFLNYQWQKANTMENVKLFKFLESVLPASQSAIIKDVAAGMEKAPMAIRLTPHIASIIDWELPRQDPIFRQFIPLGSTYQQDHPNLSLDSLHETADSPVPGLVHRYPDKVLMLVTKTCPVYCRFCTRSYAIGGHTASVVKEKVGSSPRSWEEMFAYVEKNEQIHDVVVSGGDAYYLHPEHLRLIGERLLKIAHIRRFRIASKGLAVCPSRILDPSDAWTTTLVELCRQGRLLGKEVALHTHFNHSAEITWVTRLAAQQLFREGVSVRNQTVLIRHVNDNFPTMSKLIHDLADLNIRPYYVYQADMVKGIEDMRTPLSTALELESKIRGTIAGHLMPAFVVDLPGGGGKRLVHAYESYEDGISVFKAPGVKAGGTFRYYDPVSQQQVSGN